MDLRRRGRGRVWKVGEAEPCRCSELTWRSEWGGLEEQTKEPSEREASKCS